MKYTKEANLINELISIAEIIQNPFNNEQQIRSFISGEFNISFVGFDNINKFQDSIGKLYTANQNITETLTLKTFEREIINLIRVLKNENKKCVEVDFTSIIEKLLKMKVQESEILYYFYGATMKSSSKQFGDFTIYDLKKSFNELSSKYQLNQIFFNNRPSDFLIGIKVKARENPKAVEIADKLCQSFENVFGYVIADLTQKRRIGILNFRGWTTVHKFVCNDNLNGGYQGENDIFIPVDIDDNHFTNINQGNDKIWHLITKKNKSEIERRLLNSIEWTGKAIYDKDIPKSLVQFVFAIESMLQLNDKAFITPSIVSQLSDWLAFIIEDDKDKRKLISKYFKDLYKKRSAISHGAMATIDIEDLHLAKRIAKLMIITFLKTSPFKEMTTMEQLNIYLTDLKFK
ncbi:MAG TPA: hypothetical protein VIJ57_13555 [Hanamia sp.]